MISPTDSVDDSILLEMRERVAYVTLNRPGTHNALNHPMRRSAIGILQGLNGDAEVRAIVIQGAGVSFCSGQDQNESAQMDAESAAQRISDYGELFTAVRTSEKPTIARLTGYAAGAGLQLALHCDLRIATREAQLGMTELNVGSACITGSSALDGYVTGAVMREMILYSEFYSAERAYQVGLVSELVESAKLDDRVWEVASRVAGYPPLPVKLTKEWWTAMDDFRFAETMEWAQAAHAQNHEFGALNESARNFVERSK